MFEKESKISYSLVGIGLIAFFVISTVVFDFMVGIFDGIGIEVEMSNIWFYILYTISMYGIALPIFLLITKRIKPVKITKHKLQLSLILKSIPVIACFVIFGSLIGSVLNALVATITGGEINNAVQQLLNGSNIVLLIIFVVLLFPFMEEFVFRKIIISKLSPYGERIALIASAIMFSLFHANFAQFFYAFGLGLVLGYIYIRTGSLKNCFIIHALFNFLNGVVPMYLFSSSNIDINNLEALVSSSQIPTALLIYLVLIVIQFILAIIGIVVLCSQRRKLKFTEQEKELPCEKKFIYTIFAPGMCLFMIASIVYTVLSYYL